MGRTHWKSNYKSQERTANRGAQNVFIRQGLTQRKQDLKTQGWWCVFWRHRRVGMCFSFQVMVLRSQSIGGKNSFKLLLSLRFFILFDRISCVGLRKTNLVWKCGLDWSDNRRWKTNQQHKQHFKSFRENWRPWRLNTATATARQRVATVVVSKRLNNNW